MSLAISIRNYRRIARADIELAPIALLSGPNGSGKSSVYQAALAVLTGNPLPFDGVKAQKHAAALVSRGAETGSVSARRDGAGPITVTWPQCSVTTSDATPPPSATLVATGRIKPLALDDRERAKVLQVYVAGHVSREDLAAAMTDIGFTGRVIEDTYATLERDGWDAMHKRVREHATKQKGQWEQVTGEDYGSKKGAAWKPPVGWSDELATADVSSLEREVAEAQEAYEASVGKSHVSSAAVEQLRKVVAESGTSEERIALRKDLDLIAEDLRDANAERAALPPTDNEAGIPCPKCQTPLIYDKPYRGAATLKLAGVVDDKTLKARRHNVASLDGRIGNLTDKHAAAKVKLDDATRREAAAADARTQLAEIEKQGATGATDADALALARKALADAQARLRAANDKLTADKLHKGIVKHAALADQLGPEGLRKRKMAEALATLNQSLATLSAAAKSKTWETVRLDEDLQAHFGIEPYWNCSEAQQMRVETTLQVALALMDKSDAVLIDRADRLDQRGRNGLFEMLKASGIRALVCMTANKPETVPDLARAGYGRSYFLTDGVAEELPAVRQQVAA